MQEIPTDIRTL